MRNSATFWSAFFLLCALASPGLAENENEGRYVKTTRLLAINSSLLAKAEAEYQELLQEERRDPSDNVSRRITNVRYKIQAFKDDAERLRDTLPRKAGAGKLLKEVAQKKETPIAPEVNVETERTVDEKVGRIYELHEKALGEVAAKHFEAAEKLYEEIVLLSPDDDEAYLLLGHSAIASGNYEKAADAFRNAIHIDPANQEEIPRLYENILMENPSDDEALTQMGYAQLLLGAAEKAKRAFQDALSINPSNIEARRGLLEIP